MELDATLLATCVLMAVLVALPGLQMLRRRQASREASEVAVALGEFAAAVRRERRRVPIEESLLVRAPMASSEAIAFHFARQLPSPDPEVLADSAQRLALRLKRRVAFERKMLARTAPGRRRGAVAAAAPGVGLLALRMAGIALPSTALLLLLSVEALGCWLLWHAARVEV